MFEFQQQLSKNTKIDKVFHVESIGTNEEIWKLVMTRSFDLEERLIRFASSIIQFSEMFPQTFAGRHVAGQMIRSGKAPALHYGEAQSAESRKDFIHKMKVASKELRERFNVLRIVKAVNWLPSDKLEPILNENNQLNLDIR